MLAVWIGGYFQLSEASRAAGRGHFFWVLFDRATAGRRALGRLGREDFGEGSSSLLRRAERDIEESFWLVRETMPFGSQGRYFIGEFSF